MKFQPPSISLLAALAALAALALGAGSALHAQDAAALQAWTASDGRVIQAQFVGLDGEALVVDKDGHRFSVAFAKLSPASVALARSLALAAEAAPGGAERRVAAAAPAGFARVPAGPFTMGDTLDGEQDAPLHQVTVSAFHMQINEVNRAQWDAVRSWGLKHGYPAADETDPRGTHTGSCRVGRGGGWNNGAQSCRVAARGFGTATNSGTVGFRTARSAPP